MTNKARITITIVMSLALISTGGWYYLYAYNGGILSRAEKRETYINKDKGIRIQYPKSFLSRPIDNEHEKVDYLFRADQIDPPAFFFLKFEQGGKALGTVSALGGISRIEVLRRNSERTLPSLYKNYQLNRIDDIEVAGYGGVVFTFTYDGPSGKKIKQRFTQILRDGSYIYSFIAQAPSEDFDAHVNTFKSIEDSTKFTPVNLPSESAIPLPKPSG